jgi:hypothetical protein
MGNEWSKAEGTERDKTDKVRPKVRANAAEMYCYHIVFPNISALKLCKVSEEDLKVNRMKHSKVVTVCYNAVLHNGLGPRMRLIQKSNGLHALCQLYSIPRQKDGHSIAASTEYTIY